MAINMLIGYKNPNGSVDSIFARVDGGEDQNKLFYKYYRTSERVKALIENGSNKSAIGIYISNEELDKNSKLYNKEVTMLPLYIGQGEQDSMISFSEDAFYQQTTPWTSTGQIFHDESVEKFLLRAAAAGFEDHYVYLFNHDTMKWTRGYNSQSLRDAIIANFDANSKFNYNSEHEIEVARIKLIDYMNEIDSFIYDRDYNQPRIFDTSTNDFANIDDPRLIQLYNNLISYAKTKGIGVESITISRVEEEQKESKHHL